LVYFREIALNPISPEKLQISVTSNQPQNQWVDYRVLDGEW